MIIACLLYSWQKPGDKWSGVRAVELHIENERFSAVRVLKLWLKQKQKWKFYLTVTFPLTVDQSDLCSLASLLLFVDAWSPYFFSDFLSNRFFKSRTPTNHLPLINVVRSTLQKKLLYYQECSAYFFLERGLLVCSMLSCGPITRVVAIRIYLSDWEFCLSSLDE